MVKHKIIGIKQSYIWGGGHRFAGFYLEGVVGDVDPFVSADLHPNDCFDAQITGEEYPETTLPFEEYAKRELEWAKSMVGKYLVCDRLSYTAFSTNGEVRFENE